MESSESTPNRRRRAPLRLLVVLAGEDHPKACTGRRLLHWGRVVEVSGRQWGATPPVVLDPYAPTPLSTADLPAAKRGGLLVVDCSWNRLSERGTFPGEDRRVPFRGVRRRLPLLIATNPQHYGRAAQLTTVEAFAAALSVLDRGDEARHVLDGFAGGEPFFEVNRERIDRYRAARSAADIGDAERSLFGGA
jgi:rRNA small subunit aminocarboxypropyltransferase